MDSHMENTNPTFWPIGVVLAVLGAANGTAAKQLIAASTHYRKPWMFHLGSAVNLLGAPMFTFGSMFFAPLVLVAPFACLDIVLTNIVTRYTMPWQHQALNWQQFVGISLVVVGIAFLPFVAEKTEHSLTVADVEKILSCTSSIMYMLLEASLLGILIALSRKFLTGNIRGAILAFVAGALCGNTFLVKCALSILQTDILTGDGGIGKPLPWILAVCGLFLALAGHIFLKEGLRHFKAVFVVTIFCGTQVVANCISGTIIMSEIIGFWRNICYWLLLFFMLLGMAVLSAAPSMYIEVAHAAGGDIEAQNIGRGSEIDDEKAGLKTATEDAGDHMLCYYPEVSIDRGEPFVLRSDRAKRLQDEITLAKSSIIIFCSYTDMPTVREIVPLLADRLKADSNCTVAFYYEPYPFDKEKQKIVQYIDELLGDSAHCIDRSVNVDLAAGLPFVFSGTVHYKICIFDNCRILYGSANFLEGCFFMDDTSAASDLPKSWVPHHFNEFDIMLSLSAPFPELGAALEQTAQRATKSPCLSKFQLECKNELWVLPRGVNGRSQALGNMLKGRMRITMFNMQLWPSGAFREALELRLTAGAVLDMCGSTRENSTVQKAYCKANRWYANSLKKKGEIKYREWANGSLLHAKIIVLDADTVLLPSFNFSHKALEVAVEDETLLVLKATLGRKLADHFLKLIDTQPEVDIGNESRTCAGPFTHAIERLL